MGLVHGTTTGYSHYKCRCDDCREAVRKYAAARRAGTWQPTPRPELKPCSGPECDRLARYVTPRPLCQPHKAQLDRSGVLKPLIRHRMARDGVKECSRCGEVLPVSVFNRQLNRHQSACKRCTSISVRARKYGLSFAEMKALLEGSCAGCGVEVQGKAQHVDHDHATGKVRGVLCHNCNTVLTRHMTPTILRALADYLDR